MFCFDREELEQFLKSEVSEQLQRNIRDHVANCSICHSLLSEVAGNLDLMDSLHSVLEAEDECADMVGHIPDSIGGYSIKREVGRGGMGIVYEAHQSSTRRSVALKILRGSAKSDSYRVKLFKREAQALARLKHPGIASIHDAGHTNDGQHFLVMDLVDGIPLDEYARINSMENSKSLALFVRICEAINYAHQRGVIHLDVKPSNILVDAEGLPKILDFGLARIVDPDATMVSSVTEIGKLQGTLPYMSPEQLRGDPMEIDLRSDVYSLGIILFELLTGQYPHDWVGGRHQIAAHRLHEEPPKKPRSINRTLERDLETIMLKSLETEPSRRYQSALALAEDIERFDSGQPILARPASGLYQFRKLVARHKAPFGLVLAMFLSVVGFSIWMSALYTRTQEAEQLAQERLVQAKQETVRANAASQLAATRLSDANQAREDLEVVAEFQSNMLISVDPFQMGQHVLADLRERIKKGYQSLHVPESQIDSRLDTIDKAMAQVDWSEFGSTLIRDNILQQASEAISKDFSDKPTIEAGLRKTIGYVYQKLVDYKQAEFHLTASKELYLAELGQDSSKALEVMIMLARVYQLQGRFEEAEQLFINALETNQDAHGDEHAVTLDVKASLGGLYRVLGRFEEAERLSNEALEGRLKSLSDQHLDILSTKNNLAGIYMQTGRTTKAINLLEEVLQVRLRVQGENHLETLQAKNNLGIVLKISGRLDEAELLIIATLSGLRKQLGNEHPDTLTAVANLGELYWRQGRPEKAMLLYDESLSTKRRVLGNENLSTLQSINNMAVVYSENSEYEKANALYAELLETGSRVLGDDHPLMTQATANLGTGYTQQGRYDEADALLTKAVTYYKERFGDNHESTIKAMFCLAEVYAVQEQFDKAEKLYLASFASAEQKWPNGHWIASYNKAVYGHMLTAAKRYDKSEVVLVKAFEVLKKQYGLEHKITIQIAGYLKELYEAWNRPSEIEKYNIKLGASN